MKMNKYFKDNQYCVNIKKDIIHEINFFIQLKKNNQTVLTFVKDIYIYEKF